MEKKAHIKRHKELHKCLDELIADMIKHTTALPSTTSVSELMDWSYKQTKNPEED
jgi:hypothetical protein